MLFIPTYKERKRATVGRRLVSYMNELIIRPSGPLRGSVAVGGSKNAALPILAATLLADGPSLIGNLPAIRDVELALRILQNMGCSVEKVDTATYRIDPRNAAPSDTPDPLTSKMRASVYFLGACLGRFGTGCVCRPGGCDFGTRPIDQHIKAFSSLGARVLLTDGAVSVAAPRLTGSAVRFDIVSVGATVNAILAAVCAEGETVLLGTACEPHIGDLIGYLVRAGADITPLACGSRIRIRGVKRLHGCSYSVIPDMIEAGTYLLAGAATRGAVRVRGISPEELSSLTHKLTEMGADVDEEEGSVSVFAPTRLFGSRIVTGPYPAFPTDLHPQMAALMCTALGRSHVREDVWRHRFRYVEELLKMGATVSVCENAADILGGGLTGAYMTAPDLRGGAALLIAACAAEGESRLGGISYIERGYENFVEKFRSLGADITPV